MADDVIMRARSSVPIERGGAVVGVTPQGTWQRLDEDDHLPEMESSGEFVPYQRLKDRFDNKGYYQ
jgi:hypothetical protein